MSVTRIKRNTYGAIYVLRFMSVLDQLLQPQRQHLRRAILAHRDAVDRIGGFDSPAVVGDKQELGLLGQVGERRPEAPDIGLIQRGVYLGEYAEGRGVDLEDREEQCRRGQRALAAGEQREG